MKSITVGNAKTVKFASIDKACEKNIAAGVINIVYLFKTRKAAETNGTLVIVRLKSWKNKNSTNRQK